MTWNSTNACKDKRQIKEIQKNIENIVIMIKH